MVYLETIERTFLSKWKLDGQAVKKKTSRKAATPLEGVVRPLLRRL